MFVIVGVIPAPKKRSGANLSALLADSNKSQGGRGDIPEDSPRSCEAYYATARR